jgi:ABC-type phosphate/phosphonate transport system substrate-binding protein
MRALKQRLLVCLLVLGVCLCGEHLLYGVPPTIGVLTGESALKTSEAWSSLVNFVDEEFGIPLRYRVFDGHRPLLKALKERWIDLALLDAAWFAREQGWIRPILRTVIGGETEYRVLLIVQRNSLFYRTSDLREFELFLKQPHEEMAGFYAPLAYLGHLMQRGSIRYLETFESILKGVAYGKGDEVGAVPEYIWNQNRGSRTLEYLRILEVLPPVPTPLLVMLSSEDDAKFHDVRNTLSRLHTLEKGRQVLQEISLSGFTASELGKDTRRSLSEVVRQVDVSYGPPK